MNDELVEEVLSRLDRLGELGGDAFEILLRQVYVDAVMNFIWATLMVVVLIVGKWYLNRLGWFGHEHRFHTKPTYGGGNEGRFAGTLIASLTMGFAVFVFIGMIFAAIRRLINPEFWALNYILKSLSGGS